MSDFVVFIEAASREALILQQTISQGRQRFEMQAIGIAVGTF
jgi:hypothetical protein